MVLESMYYLWWKLYVCTNLPDSLIARQCSLTTRIVTKANHSNKTVSS